MSLQKILQNIEAKNRTQREKGTSFENIVKLFLFKDKTYSPQFAKVYTYLEWAKANQLDGQDIGIDLVAKNIDDEYCTAIQCKFYGPDAKIDKKSIDSFIAASDRTHFNRRIFVDTTTKGITDNVESQLQQSNTPFTRIGLLELENSSLDWDKYLNQEIAEQKPKKVLRPHQQDALDATLAGLQTADRGKLIMACGTGKTFTALKIAEALAGKNKNVLFLAPSLSLISQSITEWTQESDIDLQSFAVCSDTQVGKRKTSKDDVADIKTHDLAYPATTDAKKLASKFPTNTQNKMTVVFATYQSVQVISDAQNKYDLPAFDLIVCDEAHRTTGATLSNTDDSHFVKVHNHDYINGAKRLYMTATPRVYITQVKKQADEKNATLYSMDDENFFGKELYVLRFGDAVEKDLLSDYKVLVLALEDGTIAKDVQKRLAAEDNTLQLDDVTKIVGCYKALFKAGIADTEGSQPMQRAVAFCRSIKDSKLFRDEFNNITKEYISNQDNEENTFECEIQHVDGTMNTAVRNTSLSWLKANRSDNTCRILTNARCLSEGVDVPSLDAVLFVHSRKSKIDIVQSVGRVMRKAEGKKLGYVILPIVIPSGVKPAEALNNNKNYEIVWDVLNALRSHDERLDAEINRVEFGGRTAKMEIISEVKDLPHSTDSTSPSVDLGGAGDTYTDRVADSGRTGYLLDPYDSFQRAILAKIVDKCGTRTYWQDWAGDVAKIAEQHITRIKAIIDDRNSSAYTAFSTFVKELQKNVNTSVTADEVVEMLAQHIITKPVFEALFSDYNFAQNNPVSQSIQKVLDVLDKHNIDDEAAKLEGFYQSIKTRVAGVDNDFGKQKIIVELYDKFFRSAFPRMTERLGIVYTPVECVDFIIHSVNDVLQNEFGQSIGAKNTHIIDPFTGTGTFITRLIQSGLITQEQLQYKYKNELHANEIVLLAYCQHQY